ncbi:DNA polymerase domain-containing protein [Fictibacillus sp. NRS-1165]|uniref:DNA polymerase domain-containing protein n=1 Tax=Fictibacillus sp. NRS-1165 TaxID=3144463 RepID=UPI003D1A3DBD
MIVQVDGREIEITSPDKILWKDSQTTKLDYVNYLLQVCDYILPYTEDRMLMYWLFPHGLHRSKIEKRSLLASAPSWVCSTFYKEKERILLNDKATLIWLANIEAIELHVPFDRYVRQDYPTDLVFDLDPSNNEIDLALEISLELKQVLDGIGLRSTVKTSGKTGLHIFVPIQPDFRFEETRLINKFVADYMLEMYSQKVTIERVKERRGTKLYLDYLQLWRGRTIAVPYSIRAANDALVSTPVTWEEVSQGFKPCHFTLERVLNRIKEKGDIFRPDEAVRNQNNERISRILTMLQSRN